MITIRQSFQTTDGKIFLDMVEAEEHELATFKAWLASCPLLDLAQILETAGDKDPEEFYGTERDMIMTVAKRAFQLDHQEKA